MALSLYDASIPVYLQMLRNLEVWIAKAEAHAAASGADVAGYLDARLAPDMGSLTKQIQLASDAAKSGAARLAGVTAPSFPDTETTWPELKARIATTIAFVEGVSRTAVEGDDSRTVELPLPGRTMTFTARNFLLQFSLPNFLFHMVTAYGLLRSQGVPLGKMDYLAGAMPVPA
ncbi:DUF1993 family protein [Phenylobacterium sp.]|uniref:DUF1993 domain-containing protein n=1 Tax=Phenylobacterium sp. TaxID=1871053 RepID=UPI0025E70EF2|nr:DUF1993 domain-containing protein [Phenylobacterium sp.]